MLLFKILLITLGLATSAPGWERINTQEKISFLLPNYPQKLKKIVNGIPSTIYQTKDLTCVAGVVCSDMSSKKITLRGETAQAIYEELKGVYPSKRRSSKKKKRFLTKI